MYWPSCLTMLWWARNVILHRLHQCHVNRLRQSLLSILILHVSNQFNYFPVMPFRYFCLLHLLCHLSFQSRPIFWDIRVCWCVQETLTVSFFMYDTNLRYSLACCNIYQFAFLAVHSMQSSLLMNHTSVTFILHSNCLFIINVSLA